MSIPLLANQAVIDLSKPIFSLRILTSINLHTSLLIFLAHIVFLYSTCSLASIVKIVDILLLITIVSCLPLGRMILSSGIGLAFSLESFYPPLHSQ